MIQTVILMPAWTVEVICDLALVRCSLHPLNLKLLRMATACLHSFIPIWANIEVVRIVCFSVPKRTAQVACYVDTFWPRRRSPVQPYPKQASVYTIWKNCLYVRFAIAWSKCPRQSVECPRSDFQANIKTAYPKNCAGRFTAVKDCLGRKTVWESGKPFWADEYQNARNGSPQQVRPFHLQANGMRGFVHDGNAPCLAT